MSYQNIILLAILIIELIYIIRFLWKSFGNIRAIFTPIMVLVLIWVCSVLFYNITALDNGYLYLQIFLSAITLFFPLFLFFLFFFPSEAKEALNIKKILKIFFVPIVIVGLIFYDYSLIIKITDSAFGREIKFNILFIQIYLIYLSIYIIAPIRYIYKKSKKLSTSIKNQINYLMAGYVVTIFFALIGSVLMFYYHSNWIWFVAGSSIFFITLSSKALLDYQLIDFYRFIKRRFIFKIILAFALFLYTALIYIISLIIIDVSQIPAYLIILILPILLAIGYGPIKRYIIKISSKFLFIKEYKTDRVIEEIDNILDKETFDLKKIVINIINYINDVLLPTKIIFFLFDSDKQELAPYQYVGLNLTNKEKKEFLVLGKISGNSAFVKHIKKNSQIIDIDRLKQECLSGDKDKCNMLNDLKNYSFSLILPIHNINRLVGCFFVGNKKAEEVYEQHDLHLLNIIINQIASRLENAKLYTDLQNFNKELQSDIDDATKELRETNAKLSKAIDAKDEFVSIVAHQLRAPLTVIKGYLSMFYDGDLGKLEDKQKETIATVYKTNTELLDLVENLLNFSRIEDQKIVYNFDKVFIGDIFKSVLRQFDVLIKNKNIKVNVSSTPEDIPQTRGDFNKLKQVMVNLLDNAIKYTKVGGSIDMIFKVVGNDIVFEMTDNGVGMVPSDAKNMFKKFFRNTDMSYKHIEGTGLGLYIVQRFITAHDGKVWAKSEGRDKGSTFGFSIPLK